MRWVRFAILVLIVTLLNAGNALNMISVGSANIRPDLLLVLLLFIGVSCEVNDAIFASFIIGFAADISGATMGPYMLSFGVFGTVISQMRRVVIMKRMTHQAVATLILGLITVGLAEFLAALKLGSGTSNVLSVAIGTSVYSALAGPFVWMVFAAMRAWIGISGKPYGRISGR